MLIKRKIISLSIITLVASIGFYFYTPFIFNYFEMRELRAAAVGMPVQFGGVVTDYQIVCFSDPETGFCHNCPICTGAIGNYICNANSQILYTPAVGGGMGYICPIKSFIYTGGPMPTAGSTILGGGASPILPWVIGVSFPVSPGFDMNPY